MAVRVGVRTLAIPVLVVLVVLSGCVGAASPTPILTPAPPTPSPTPDATATCAHFLKSDLRPLSVAAAFPSTSAETVAAALRSGHGVGSAEPLTKLPAGTFVAWCYVDGDFSETPQPPIGYIDYRRSLYFLPAGGEPIQRWIGPARPEDLVAPDRAIP